MIIKLTILSLFSVLVIASAFGQARKTISKYEYVNRAGNCYDNKIDSSKEIFTKTEIPPKYKGRSALTTLLTQRINFFHLNGYSYESFLTDTAQVRVILHRNGMMSNLTVEKTKNESFKNNLLRVIKESACSWRPGGFSGRNVDSWVDLNIYFTVDRRKNNISLHAGYEMANEWRRKDKSRWIE